MRIDVNHEPQTLPETSRSSAQSTSAAAAASASASRVLGGEDQTDLSGAHAQVLALVAQASQLPEIREERVQALRQAVERGGYSTSPEAVAGALVAHMLAGRTAA
jgi:flagellar biosynthesis anti-sigma factor FlgM